jgi:3-oxoadipate enol-lactonase
VTDQTLSVDGAELACDTTGDGPLVVQLHGLSSSRIGDEALGFDMRPLADHGHRVVRYDARGHGASTGRPHPDDYRWPALADDLIDVLDALGATEPVDAVGASMGTATIVWAALRHPERFRRLVLLIPPTAWETRAAQAGMYLQGADLIEQRGLAGFAAMMAGAPLPPVVEELGIEMVPRLVPELAASVFRGAAASDLPPRAELAALGMPVLLLPWAGDPGHPVATAEQLLEQLLELLPDARLELASTAADVRAWPARVADFLA